MRGTLSLGRWAGIPVGANISILVIMLLVGFGLGLGQLPLVHPGLPAWAYGVAGAAAALLLVLSILLHELSHAVVARLNGLTVDRIVLWLLGGVAQLRGEPRSPRVDFAIAVIGPVVSVMLGGVFGVLAVLALAVTGPGLTATTLFWLAAINVLLAGFNLVPAAPLDGGRVLRAGLWWRSGDRTKAAVFAARAGRYFGLTLIGLGIALVLLVPWLGGLWLALIGWFLVNAAMAEEENTVLGEQLRGVRVQDVMSGTAVTAPPDTSVAEFVNSVVLRERFSTYPLVDGDGRLTGLTTLNRIRQVPVDQRDTTRLSDIACPPDQVPVTEPAELLMDLLPRLSGCADGRAVVVDPDRQVIAVVSPSDISQVAARSELRGTGAARA